MESEDSDMVLEGWVHRRYTRCGGRDVAEGVPRV